MVQIKGTSIVVVGSGVAGLSCAYQLAKAGCDVTILAKELPGEHNIMYTSDWAGAGCGLGGGIDEKTRRVTTETFQELWELSGKYPHAGINRVTAEIYFDEKPDESKLWFKPLAPDFRVLDPSEYPVMYAYGISYTSITVEPPIYLPWLTAQVKSLGVKIVRMTVYSLAAALAYVPEAKAVVNASGHGARYLEDVQDKTVFPQRGQTTVLKTDFKKMVTRAGAEYTYIIPRVQSGEVILGGIREDWLTSPDPKPETREMFMKRAYAICPALGPPEKMVVARDIVGVRSTRPGGYRVEREEKDGMIIAHAYGFAGGGYGNSMGSAKEVVRLLKGII